MNRFRILSNLLKLSSTCSNLKQFKYINTNFNNNLFSPSNKKSKNVPNDQMKIQ
jgi:hypothetical protein